MKLNKNSFKLIKENENKYKFIILNKIKYIYISIYNKNIDKNDLIKSKLKDKKIKEIENKSNKLKKDNIYNNFDIKLKEPIYILNLHKDTVYCFTILKDGRLASGSYDSRIIIYNKKTYQLDFEIKEHRGAINCIITLSSGILASCSWDSSIKLFNIIGNEKKIMQTLNYHTDEVFKIIELKNKTLVSCSNDNFVIFYNKDKIKNKYVPYHKLSVNNYCFNIIETKDNEICYSEKDKTIYFYNVLQKQIMSKINDIDLNTYTIGGFTMINKKLLLIPGINQISIININNLLVKTIYVPNSSYIIGVCLLNENILLTGDNSRTIIQWEIEGDNLIFKSKKENAHNGAIFSIIKTEDGHIITGSDDKSIKIWQNNN